MCTITLEVLVKLNSPLLFGFVLIFSLLAFEVFNYSVTDYALTDLLGNLSFFDLRWATILTIAFCGIDFAGLARLFIPQTGNDDSDAIWYLLGAWLLAATMNAMLTWWGISIAILNHPSLGAGPDMLRIIPIVVAVLAWLIRILIIGTFSISGDRILKSSS